MGNKQLKFWYWFVKWLVPNKIKYFCFMHIMVYATTGKYSNVVVPDLTGLNAIKCFRDDKQIQ
jgi:hypothetical protein